MASSLPPHHFPKCSRALTAILTASGADDSQDHRHEDLVIGENRAQQEGWQLFYDYDSSPGEPIPWWFNSSTGESTWECPVSMPISQGLFGSATSEEQQVHKKGTVIRGGVPTVDANSEHRGTISSPWTQRWSDEHQARLNTARQCFPVSRDF